MLDIDIYVCDIVEQTNQMHRKPWKFLRRQHKYNHAKYSFICEKNNLRFIRKIAENFALKFYRIVFAGYHSE